jgi:hypothetical protein
VQIQSALMRVRNAAQRHNCVSNTRRVLQVTLVRDLKSHRLAQGAPNTLKGTGFVIDEKNALVQAAAFPSTEDWTAADHFGKQWSIPKLSRYPACNAMSIGVKPLSLLR